MGKSSATDEGAEMGSTTSGDAVITVIPKRINEWADELKAATASFWRIGEGVKPGRYQEWRGAQVESLERDLSETCDLIAYAADNQDAGMVLFLAERVRTIQDEVDGLTNDFPE